MTLEPKDAFGLRDENHNKTLEISMFPNIEMIKAGKYNRN